MFFRIVVLILVFSINLYGYSVKFSKKTLDINSKDKVVQIQISNPKDTPLAMTLKLFRLSQDDQLKLIKSDSDDLTFSESKIIIPPNSFKVVKAKCNLTNISNEHTYHIRTSQMKIPGQKRKKSTSKIEVELLTDMEKLFFISSKKFKPKLVVELEKIYDESGNPQLKIYMENKGKKSHLFREFKLVIKTKKNTIELPSSVIAKKLTRLLPKSSFEKIIPWPSEFGFDESIKSFKY